MCFLAIAVDNLANAQELTKVIWLYKACLIYDLFSCFVFYYYTYIDTKHPEDVSFLYSDL